MKTGSLRLATFLLCLLMGYNYSIASSWVEVAGSSTSDLTTGITTDDNGNVFATGAFEGTAMFTSTVSAVSNGDKDIFLTRSDADGNLQWMVNFGSLGEDQTTSITTDANGNIIITGFFEGNMDVDGSTMLMSNGGTDAFMASFDAMGNLNWAISGGGSGTDRAVSLTTEASGSLLVTGSFEDQAIFGNDTLVSNGMSDIFVVRLSSTGSVTWSYSTGSIDDDFGTGIVSETNGSFFLNGSFNGTVDFDGNTVNALFGAQFLVRFDASSSASWAQEINGVYTLERTGLAIDSVGNLYVTGNFEGAATFGTSTLVSAGSEDMFVLKLDSSGNYIWAMAFGGSGFDSGRDISISDDGMIFVAGTYESTINTTLNTFTSQGMSDAIVLEMMSDGTVMGDYSIGGQGSETVTNISGMASGDFLLTGSFEGTVTFATETVTSQGEEDGFTYRNAPLVSVEGPQPTEMSFSVYPNPVANGAITIQIDDASAFPMTAEIYTISGQKVSSHTLNSGFEKIDLNVNEAGVYFLNVQDANATSAGIKKIVVQ